MDAMRGKNYNPLASISGSNPVQSASTTNQNQETTRETRMARREFGYLPRENPCAQCGEPIAAPDWIENGPRRISYLWRCKACNYRFEAVAFYDASQPDRETPLAA
jgi:hypothetical protein